MAATLADIDPGIIRNHILHRLDGRSLSTIATVSSCLHAYCSDHNLWSHVCKCMWPSITHPHVNELISIFPGGHRSFFQDSFPSLVTDVNQCDSCSSSKLQPDCTSSCYIHRSSHSHPWPSQLISVVDIRYQNDIIYSTVQFTNTTTDFLSSYLLIKLNEDQGNTRPIDMEVDELAALSHLRESLTLHWIIIDPTLKRAGNLSSTKPVTVKRAWMTNETLVKYITVLPGCDPNEMVQCRIQVVLGVGKEEGLQVKEVTMKLMNLDSSLLNGKDFLVISQGAILMENNVRRKVVNDKERWKSWNEFKEMKRQRRELVRIEEVIRKGDSRKNYIGIFVTFCLSLYFLSLILQ